MSLLARPVSHPLWPSCPRRAESSCVYNYVWVCVCWVWGWGGREGGREPSILAYPIQIPQRCRARMLTVLAACSDKRGKRILAQCYLLQRDCCNRYQSTDDPTDHRLRGRKPSQPAPPYELRTFIVTVTATVRRRELFETSTTKTNSSFHPRECWTRSVCTRGDSRGTLPVPELRGVCTCFTPTSTMPTLGRRHALNPREPGTCCCTALLYCPGPNDSREGGAGCNLCHKLKGRLASVHRT